MSFVCEYPLSHDPVAKKVFVGGVTYDQPLLARRKEWDTTIKLEVAGVAPDGHPKKLNAFYCEKLGPQFNRRFQAAMYHTWVAPHMSQTTADMLRHAGWAWHAFSDNLVRQAHEALPYVQEAERDGLYHIIPAIVAFRAPPADIKKKVGKATWRRIAANSRTRNATIMQCANSAEAFVDFLDIKSGHLIGAGTAFLDSRRQLRIASRIAERSNTRSLYEAVHLVRDTELMLGDDFNPDWSRARMIREHDRAARAKAAAKFSSKPFAEPATHASKGLSARLLTSKAEIASEGAAMRHCVASYAGLAENGDYQVWAIDGDERATLGLTRHSGVWAVDQVYGHHNTRVSSETRAFAEQVCQQLDPKAVAA